MLIYGCKEKQVLKGECKMTNLKQLQNVCKEVNEKMDVISEEELKEIVGRYYKGDVISCRQWELLLGYIERKEKISDSFAFMYSE